MVAEDTLRHRLSTQARAVRTRIAAWVVLLTAVALLGAGLAAYVVQSDRIDRRINQDLSREIHQFKDLSQKTDPRTGLPYNSAKRLLNTALSTNLTDDNEAVVAFIGGRPKFVSPTPPEYRGLQKDPRFLQAVRDLLPRGGSRRLDTSLGEIVMAVQPVNDATTKGAYVPVYFPAGERAEFMAVMRTYALVAGAALVLVMLGAWLVAGRLLRPVRQLRNTAQEIGDTDLSRRITTTGNDDLTDLGNTFNAMLDRLEDSFAQQRRFFDDAGHELRTPMTIVRGHVELLDPHDPEETKATQGLLLDEIDRMGRLIDDMIVLAKAGRPDFLRFTEVDIGMLTDEVLDKVRALGDREWKLDARGEGTVLLDPQRITQALVQLATNAVQHTSPGDVIAIGSLWTPQEVVWWVRDSGPGVSRDDTTRIFDRFERGVDTRADGSGLGLSIVQAIADAHGGEVSLESKPDEGATFVIAIPPWGRLEQTEGM